ncbi:TauD/TfdA dioxygenase family protein [Roseateles toxinivorans]|uniref:Alpha-ketoglutarate-dependent taurine dioxygenase n=1 Tax=Roseateles toxinivorans TaxID=270368 RepID=A0A4R6QHP6_9BURK|nr:TauD/TfdA family dioxygenase [Roseateles toxinivorans]TDP62062.1 alpha-ketoglutarate-dependent taurine dioxygenase [Roseateles toxinivorans]
MTHTFSHLRAFGTELALGRLSAERSDAAVLQQLRAAVLHHGFVVLRDQRFTDAALLALGRQFGRIEERVIKYSTIGPSSTRDATRWHHHSNCAGALDDWILYYTPAVPATGGSIEFFDAQAWFDGLSDTDRSWARNQQMRHDFTSVAHAGIPPIAEPPWHPMVVERRLEGQVHEALYMGAHAVEAEDGSNPETATSNTALGRMRELSTADPTLYHLHSARAHDLILWDMKTVAHRGHPWHAEELRVIHEVIIREADL